MFKIKGVTLPAACCDDVADFCRAESSAWWVTAVVVVAVLGAAQIARLVGMVVEGAAVSAEAGEGPGLGLQGLRASAGCRECVRVSLSAPDWQIEGGRLSGGRVQVRIHLWGR